MICSLCHLLARGADAFRDFPLITLGQFRSLKCLLIQHTRTNRGVGPF